MAGRSLAQGQAQALRHEGVNVRILLDDLRCGLASPVASLRAPHTQKKKKQRGFRISLLLRGKQTGDNQARLLLDACQQRMLHVRLGPCLELELRGEFLVAHSFFREEGGGERKEERGRE